VYTIPEMYLGEWSWAQQLAGGRPLPGSEDSYLKVSS